jgi:hypothetical protein
VVWLYSHMYNTLTSMCCLCCLKAAALQLFMCWGQLEAEHLLHVLLSLALL